jgi:hypothetical protein
VLHLSASNVPQNGKYFQPVESYSDFKEIEKKVLTGEWDKTARRKWARRSQNGRFCKFGG